MTHDGKINEVIASLDSLERSLSLYQFRSARKEISELAGKYVKGVDDNLAALFEVLINLDKASSYDQVAKLIVDVGELFFDLSRSRLLSNLSNLQAYLIVDSDSNRVEIKVEDFILFLGDKYINDASSFMSMYFTLGYSYSFSGDDDFNNFSYAAEKIGLKFKMLDFNQKRLFKTRYYIPRQKPIINDLYVLGYVSGLLYQIEPLRSESETNGSVYGVLFGAHFFNDLDFGIGASSIGVLGKRGWVLTTAFDIPITEYIGRLGRNSGKNREDR